MYNCMKFIIAYQPMVRIVGTKKEKYITIS